MHLAMLSWTRVKRQETLLSCEWNRSLATKSPMKLEQEATPDPCAALSYSFEETDETLI